MGWNIILEINLGIVLREVFQMKKLKLLNKRELGNLYSFLKTSIRDIWK